MTYKEYKTKVSLFETKTRIDFINSNCDINVNDIVVHSMYEGKKKLWEEKLVFTEVSTDKEGNITGYFFHTITPTGRIGSNCAYMTNFTSKFWSCGKHYKETIKPYGGMTLQEYKETFIKKKKSA